MCAEKQRRGGLDCSHRGRPRSRLIATRSLMRYNIKYFVVRHYTLRDHAKRESKQVCF